jgi:hypothetical protein
MVNMLHIFYFIKLCFAYLHIQGLTIKFQDFFMPDGSIGLGFTVGCVSSSLHKNECLSVVPVCSICIGVLLIYKWCSHVLR